MTFVSEDGRASWENEDKKDEGASEGTTKSNKQRKEEESELAEEGYQR